MEPAYLGVTPVNVNGSETNRLMIVLTTKGCEYAHKTGGGCTVCGFINHAKANITEEEIVSQLDFSLQSTDLSEVEEIDLLTLGSFFNDQEVSRHTRIELLNRIARLSNIKRVSIESRPEYVNFEKLRECKNILGDKVVELGIGLESSDDYIRNTIIKKNLSRKKFEKTVQKIGETCFCLLVYLLIKPPSLLEKEAITDAVNSVKYVYGVSKEYNVKFRIAFEPVFICRNTPLENLFLNAEYRLVNLWSVVEVIKQTHHYSDLFVGLSDENLSLHRMPFSCNRCYDMLISEIDAFNRSQDIAKLARLDCECKKGYIQKMEGELI